MIEGRTVVWSQIQTLRTPMTDLKERYPEYAEKLARASEALDRAGRRDAATALHLEEANSRASLDQEAAMHRQHAQDFKALLGAIRGLPGFSNFLLPKTAEALLHVADDGPVACINMHESRCDALVLMNSSLHHVPLPGLTPNVAKDWHDKLNSCLGLKPARDRKHKSVAGSSEEHVGGLLLSLWSTVVRPILDLITKEVRTAFSKGSIA